MGGCTHSDEGRRRARRAPATRLAALAGALLAGLPWLSGGCALRPSPSAAPPALEPLLRHTRQLTFDGLRSGEGYFSADGRRLVFQSEREPGNPFYQIYQLELARGLVTRVSSGVGKATCGWLHPDGRRALFASTHANPESAAEQQAELAKRAAGEARRYSWDFDRHYEVYERDLHSGTLRALAPAEGYDAEGSWSPDGTRLLFASNRHAYAGALPDARQADFERDPANAMELYLADADGNDLRRLTDAAGYDGGPFFSADGEQIVWRRFAPDGRTAEIMAMELASGEERSLTRLAALSWAPYFHPSGDYVVFATSLQGHDNFELYLVDAAGQRDPVRVTNRPGFDGLPAFSPDGRQLTWSSGRTPDRRPQIFLADWDHAAARASLGLPATRDPGVGDGRAAPEISATALRAHVEHLASPALAGRATGSEGERRATDYVAKALLDAGLEPAGDDGTPFEAFPFTAGVSAGPGNALRIEGDGAATPLQLDVSWRPLALSRVGPVEASPLVFAGYGIVVPEGADTAPYDAYAGLDVRDKWVMVLRYLPEDAEPARGQALSRYAGLRTKAMLARDRGALGLVVVSGPRSQVRAQLIPLRADAAHAATSIAAVSVSDSAAARMLAASGHDLTALQTALDLGKPLPGFEVPELRLSAQIDLVQEQRIGRNVLARLPAPDPDATTLVIGAHVDHLGHGLGGQSLAREQERGLVHPGADDNASGVAVLIEVAQRLAALTRDGQLRPQRHVLFAAWSGEELGLIGSSHHVARRSDDPHAPLTPDVAANLNLDMVGRFDESLALHGMGSSDAWPQHVEQAAAPLGLALTPVADSTLPTDATAFVVRGVPVLSLFTGAHPQYHTPQDTADRLDYASMARIADLTVRLASRLAEDAAPLPYTAPSQPSGPLRAGLRAYLGTIPDYARTDLPGVLLSGVTGGGPAEAAGLRGGDRILEVGGRRIENIYDYTYALDALEIGEPVVFVVERDGESLLLAVTPASRN